MDLKSLNDIEIMRLVNENKISMKDFVDSGICPTCFDKSHNNVLFGNNKNKMLYENEEFECFLVGNPRAKGHTAISTKKHYKDMLDIDDEICNKVFTLAKKIMIVIKEVYGCESVYLCTMCDGPMNHFHIQLIPRYNYEKRGSKNFVKPRCVYEEDIDKVVQIREILKK
ncbi:MAG: HIT family protein [Clostridia bacterium]|nr:HIT family protein [Clostridia bacterium]